MKNQLVSLLEIIKLAEDEKTSEKYIRYICGLDSTKECSYSSKSRLSFYQTSLSRPNTCKKQAGNYYNREIYT